MSSKLGRRPRGGNDLKRKTGGKTLKREHHIFCEGKTEQAFLDGFRIYHRISAMHVSVHGQVGEPKKILQTAKAKRDELRNRDRNGQMKNWVVYAVFDRDEHRHFQSACTEAEDSNIIVGVSVPCFELWLVWLKEDWTSSQERDAMQRKCREVHPGYDHDTSPTVAFDDVAELVDEAIRREAEVANRHSRASDERYPNPSSTFGRVMRELLKDVDE